MKWHPPEEIRFRRVFPKFEVAMTGSIAVVAVSVAITSGTVALPWIVIAVVMAAGAWMRSSPPFSLHFSPAGMEHHPSGLRVPFADVAGVYLSDAPLIAHGPARDSLFLVVAHPQGVWRLPSNPSLDREAFYHFLLAETRLLAPPASYPGGLAAVVAAEMAEFPGKVLSSGGRPLAKGETGSAWPMWTLTVALVLGRMSAPMAGWDTRGRSDGLFYLSVVVGFLALIYSAAFAVRQSAMRKQRAASGIVVSPRSLTLETPGLKGILQWAEIKKVGTRDRPISGVRSVILELDGGAVDVSDDFTCPLTEIHRLIVHYLSYENR